MNREEIIRMALEAGISNSVAEYYWIELGRMLASERERLKWDGIHSCHPECDRPACVHTRKAVEAEREECAKILAEQAIRALSGKTRTNEFDRLTAKLMRDMESKIRAKGQE